MIHLRAPIVVSQPGRRGDFARVGEEAYSLAKQVQIALIALDYDLGPSGADGKIGPLTNGAIVAFKKEHGISPVSTTITDELMRELVAAVAAKSAPPPEPTPKDTYRPPTTSAPSPKSKGIGATGIAVIVLAVLAVGAGIYAVAT